eukprot:s43_g3.t1
MIYGRAMLIKYRRRWKVTWSKFGSETEALLQQLDFKPTRTTFHHTLRTLAQKGRAQLILQAFAAQMQSRNFGLTERDYTVGITACGRSKLWQDACWLLHTMREAKLTADLFTYNATIAACEKGGQWQQAMILFGAMKAAKVDPDVVIYSSSISACEKGGQWQQALCLFEEMKRTKVTPNVITYNATISACEKGGQWEQALMLFSSMQTANAHPDVISYSASISACEKGGQWHQALNLFKAMQKAKVTPNVISYSATISACEKGGQWQHALTLLGETNAAEMKTSVISYNATMSACQKGGQWQQALSLLEAMLAAEVQPDMVTYSVLLDCRHLASEKSRQGLELYEKGLLPILKKSSALKGLKVDLHYHSEGAARLTLLWWLSNTVARRLEGNDRLECTVVTGRGRSRQTWDTTDVQAAALDLLKSLKLDVWAAGEVPTVLRSRFWFAFDVTGTSQGDITGKVEQAKSDWQKFVATELYPYLLVNSGDNKKVYARYAGDFLTSLELLDTLQSDLLFALGSVAFVLLCLWFQLQAVWLSFVSLFIILLSLPIAYVLTPAEKLTVTSFLALFLIVGIGSDTVFVYADIWEQEAHLPMEDRIPAVLMSAGVNCLATSLTTSASFLANLASVLQPLREFGFFMGLCVLWCFASRPHQAGQIPRRLTFHNDFNSSLAGVTLPSKLQNLTFGNGFNQSLVGVALPSSLKSLTFGDTLLKLLQAGTLPSSVKSLTCGEGLFNQNLETVALPSNLESLRLGGNISNTSIAVLPSSLKSLTFGGSFNQSLDGITMPSNLRSLTFGPLFNQSLERVTLPSSLESLTFGNRFNQSLERVALPSCLKSLSFGDGCNQRLKRVTLPNRLQKLTFGCGFNQSLVGVTLPSSLKSLTFGAFLNRWLAGVTLPSSLKNLTLGEGLINQSLEAVDLPSGLENLTLGGHMTSLDRVFLPSSLKSLTFGGSFNHSLDGIIMPSSFENLTFGPLFNQSLERVTLPSCLKSLTFGRNFDRSLERILLPSSLESLTFGNGFNQSLERVSLPSSLESLTLGDGFNQNLDGVLITLYLPPLLVIQSRRKQKKVETEVVVVGVVGVLPGSPPKKKRKRCARLTRSYIEALARRVAFCPGVVLAVSFLMLGLFVLGIVLDIEVATGVPQVFPDNHNQVQYPILEAQFTAVAQVDVKAAQQSREEKVCKGDAEWGSFSPTYDCDLFWCDADSTTPGRPRGVRRDDCWYSEITSSSGAGVSSLTSCASVSFNARVASASRPETAATETALQSMAAALGSDRYLYSNNSVAITELKTLDRAPGKTMESEWK